MKKRAAVSNWKMDRFITFNDQCVSLQVTVPECSHCPTCQRRVVDFKNLLFNSPERIHFWEYKNDGAYWITFPLSSGEDPIEVLRKNLEISIHVYPVLFYGNKS